MPDWCRGTWHYNPTRLTTATSQKLHVPLWTSCGMEWGLDMEEWVADSTLGEVAGGRCVMGRSVPLRWSRQPPWEPSCSACGSRESVLLGAMESSQESKQERGKQMVSSASFCQKNPGCWAESQSQRVPCPGPERRRRVSFCFLFVCFCVI